MLFKTLSASVYGIDAYLVEVEVDVGSARMTDFNVVGLPDNAVKEGRTVWREFWRMPAA
jgi:magnesium chelatase family protein